MSDIFGNSDNSGIAAIVAPCSARKEKLPLARLQSSKLRKASQEVVTEAWLDRLQQIPVEYLMPARHLYAGEGIRRLRNLADTFGRPFFVVSTGLGLVAGDTAIPPYELTLSPTARSPLFQRIQGAFSHSQWWRAVQNGPFASTMVNLSRQRGRILVALTRPYAELVGSALAALSSTTRSRLRLFGPGISAHLPPCLHGQVIFYDARLDVLVPGTRLNAAARSLDHFARLIADRDIDTMSVDQANVEAALSTVVAQAAIHRPRVNDATLKVYIERLTRQGLSATNALRHLRTQTKVACEERRFRRLYEEAMA